MTTSEFILILLILSALVFLGWKEHRMKKRRRLGERAMAQYIWRQHATEWVEEQVAQEKILLCFIADKESIGKELRLVEFGCTRCTLRFWTENGRQLAPACCPHCGMQFTQITMAPDLCKAN